MPRSRRRGARVQSDTFQARRQVDVAWAPAQSWSDLPLDQTLALTSAATRLADQFTGVFGAETIERFLHTSFDQFADRATIPTFLPLRAERFARQRLRALAKVAGLHDDGKPTVLFLCTHNAGRSQEGYSEGLLSSSLDPRRRR